MVLTLSTICRGACRPLLWVCLATLALGWWGPREGRALDLLGLDVAAAEVRTALDQMAEALNAAPLEVQTAVGADLHLMSQAVMRALGRLESGAVPIVDPTLVYDLNLLADIAQAATDELQEAEREDRATLTPARVERIDALTDAASFRLVEVNLVIDGWTERGRNAVVELTEVGGELVVRSTDRLVHNAVRYTSIGLLLVGLLVVGLQLLRMSEDRVDSLALLRETPVLSILAVTALTLFFVGCFAFSLYPGSLAALSAEIREHPQEHPCERLAEQRDRLIAAQQVQHVGLIEATKERMAPAARDCLGLPSDVATAEAIDLLAAKTAVAGREPLGPPPAEVALEVEPQEPPGEAEGTTAPAVPAGSDRALTTEVDALAELVTQLRDAEDALAERLEDAVAEEFEQVDSVPAPGPEPAAGPASPDDEAGLAPADQAGEPATADEAPEPVAADDAAPPAPTDDAADPAAADEAAGPADEGSSDEVATPALSPAPPDEAAAPPAEAVSGEGSPQSEAALADNAPASSNAPVESNAELYVTTTAVNYRDGPSLDARRLGTFVPGATLAVISQNDGWSEVRLGDGREVFVASEFLELAP